MILFWPRQISICNICGAKTLIYRIFLDDLNTDEENELLKTSDDELRESPIHVEDLYTKCKTVFKTSDINTSLYWKEVRRILFAKMETKDKLSGIYWTSFQVTFDRKKGKSSTWPAPKYDAICLLLGKPRTLFDNEGFMKKYPSVKQQILYLRKEMGVRIDNSDVL